MSSLKILVTILVSVIAFPFSACNQEDKAALLEFKKSFPPKYFDGWTDATDCCFWDYVGCNSNTGRVNSLQFSDNENCDDISCAMPFVDVHGSIPASIGDISTLETVFFDYLPHLVGPIPPRMSKLKNLRLLTIYNTSVSGPIPSSLSQLQNLSFLDLRYNKLCGQIPGGKFAKFDADYYSHNKCLCGAPLPACK